MRAKKQQDITPQTGREKIVAIHLAIDMAVVRKSLLLAAIVETPRKTQKENRKVPVITEPVNLKSIPIEVLHTDYFQMMPYSVTYRHKNPTILSCYP